MKDKFWIDIKDRKPEYPNVYYICREPHSMLFEYDVCWWDRDKGFPFADIVAWAQIPEYEHKHGDRYK